MRLVTNRITDTFYERALTEECSLFSSQITRKKEIQKNISTEILYSLLDAGLPVYLWSATCDSAWSFHTTQKSSQKKEGEGIFY